MILMRDKNLSFIQFEEQLRKEIERKTSLPKLLRTAVIDNPTLLEDLIILYPRKFKELLGISIYHYYYPENLRWRVLLDLKEKSYSNLNRKQRMEILIVQNSKKDMLLYLYRTRKYSSHEIFGNIIKDGSTSTRQLQVFRENTKVIRTRRKRGYDDKGSLRPKDKWLPQYDFSLTELQQEKEKETDLIIKIINRYLKNLRKPEMK